MRGYPLALSAVLLAFWAVGCKPSGDLDPDMSRPADFGFQTTPEEAILAEGARAYQVYCVGCHGENGDGQSEAAVFLDPKPRDFVKADFKFSSTRSGKLPTDADLALSIREGLRGSAMPSWELLPDRTIKAMVVYIKTFSDKWKQRAPALPIPKVDDPYLSTSDKSAAIQRGEAVYHGYATCWTCHPAYVSQDKINGYLVAMENPSREVFRSNLVQSEGKVNTLGEMVYPPDFLRDFVRAGASVDVLYRSIAAGITSTAMPTWVDSIDFPSERDPSRMLVQRSDIWAMAYYVHDLITQRPQRIAEDEVVIRERPQWISLTGEPSPYAAAAEEDATTGEEFLDEDEE